MLHRFLGATLGLMLAAVVAGCGGGSAGGEAGQGPPLTPEETALYDAARQTGTLTWYSVLPPTAIETTVEAFERRYPDISVESLRLSSGPMSTRYSQERSAGAVPADVVTISNPEFFATAAQRGWFETQLDLPALAEWPDQYYTDGRATTGLLPLLIGYNTNRVPEAEAPTEWRQLLDPRWQGQMLLGDPRTVPAYLALAQLWYEQYGPDYLSQFAAQNPTVVPSIVPGSQQLAAGGAALLVPNSFTVLAPLIDDGAPVAATTVSPTTGVEYVSAISTGAPNSAAARLFMNFLLTPQGQAAHNAGGGTSALGQVSEDTVPLPAEYQPLDPLFERARANEQELLRLLGIAGQ